MRLDQRQLCAVCGHLDTKHRRPRILYALLGRWSCRYIHWLKATNEHVRCACDGWKAA